MLTICHRFFLVEGVVTIAFGVLLWFILPDCKPILSRLVMLRLTIVLQFPPKPAGSAIKRRLSYKLVFLPMHHDPANGTSTSRRS